MNTFVNGPHKVVAGIFLLYENICLVLICGSDI